MNYNIPDDPRLDPDYNPLARYDECDSAETYHCHECGEKFYDDYDLCNDICDNCAQDLFTLYRGLKFIVWAFPMKREFCRYVFGVIGDPDYVTEKELSRYVEPTFDKLIASFKYDALIEYDVYKDIVGHDGELYHVLKDFCLYDDMIGEEEIRKWWTDFLQIAGGV